MFFLANIYNKDNRVVRYMGKDNKKLTIIIFLLLVVFGLSIGLATFSSVLKINSSANVSPDASSLKVIMSGSATDTNLLEVPPSTGTYVSKSGVATITNGTTSEITGLNAYLVKPGDRTEYAFYIHNVGNLTAYLRQVNTGPRKCIAGEGATDALVQATCSHISISYSFPDLDPSGYASSYPFKGEKYNIPKNGYTRMKFTVYYGVNAQVLADGPFTVEIAPSTVNFSSVYGS